MKLPLFTLLFCLVLVGFMACDKDDPEPEQLIEIEYPEAPEINTVLQFKQAESADSIGIEKFFDSNGRLLALSHHNGVLISDDQGQNWSTSNTGIDAFGFENGPKIYIEARDINKGENELYVLTDRSVYKSSDNGTSWNSTHFERDASTFGAGDIGVFNDETVYVSGGSGRLQFYYSDNSGENWERISQSFNDFMREFHVNNNTAYSIRSGDGIICSNDNGRTWSSIGMDEKYCYGLTIGDDLMLTGAEKELYIKYADADWAKTNTKGLEDGQFAGIHQIVKHKDWLVLLSFDDKIYVSKLIENKVADWQKLELNDLDVFDHDLISIKSIYYFDQKLFVGTLDIHSLGRFSTAYGRGIWYADFSLD